MQRGAHRANRPRANLNNTAPAPRRRAPCSNPAPGWGGNTETRLLLTAPEAWKQRGKEAFLCISSFFLASRSRGSLGCPAAGLPAPCSCSRLLPTTGRQGLAVLAVLPAGTHRLPEKLRGCGGTEVPEAGSGAPPARSGQRRRRAARPEGRRGGSTLDAGLVGHVAPLRPGLPCPGTARHSPALPCPARPGRPHVMAPPPLSGRRERGACRARPAPRRCCPLQRGPGGQRPPRRHPAAGPSRVPPAGGAGLPRTALPCPALFCQPRSVPPPREG